MDTFIYDSILTLSERLNKMDKQLKEGLELLKAQSREAEPTVPPGQFYYKTTDNTLELRREAFYYGYERGFQAAKISLEPSRGPAFSYRVGEAWNWFKERFGL